MDLDDNDMAGYLEENENMQEEQWRMRNGPWQKRADVLRFEQINGLKRNAKLILSVGCGPKEPIAIGATHACDIALSAEKYLRAQGWTGEFKQCSCDKLPYPDKFFDFAVMSEVIEHLPTLEDCRNAILELNRVSKRWLITTPWVNRDQGNREPTHKHFFDEKSIHALVPDWVLLMVRYDIFLFITRCVKDGCSDKKT